MAEVLFSLLDYTFFVLTLSLSALIGVYFGFLKKQSTANDYLLGGKQMGIWPVALSLASSTLSGLTLLALPGDIYKYGISYWLSIPLFAVVLYISYKIYLPVFYNLQITSTYEYLKLRFDNRIRILASVLYTIYSFLYLPIVIYAPALALAQATGINTHVITTVLCTICIFYTTLGGIKAVIWTDALQFFMMIISVTIVFIIGILFAGGLSNIWELNLQTGRLDIEFSLDLTKRDSFWTGTIALSAGWLAVAGVSQGTIQKCLSLPSFNHIKVAMLWFFIAFFLMVTMCSWSGIIMFAKYFDCDPLESQKIKTADQLLPLYVMDVASAIPGLPGLFVSGIFSATLSTLSASMNCLAATIYEDFISHFVRKGINEKRKSNVLKLLVVGIGVVCTSLVFVVEQLGTILPLAFAFGGITTGPLLGLFSVGMLVPMVNCIGALVGGASTLIIMTWIVLAAQYYKSTGAISYPSLPVYTHGCNITVNETISTTMIPNAMEHDEPFALYRVSFYFYTVLGVLIMFIISITVSYFTKEDETLNKDCISPVSQRFIRKGRPPSYYSVEKAANIVEEHSK